MALEQVGLRAIIEGMTGFRAAANEIDKTQGRLGTSAEKAAGRMSTLGDIAKTAIGFAVGTVAVKAIGKLTGVVGEFITVGPALVDMEDAFISLAETYGLAADEMLWNMSEAAKGTISNSKLIAAANKALIGSGKELGKEFGVALPRLLEMARASAKATGDDVGFLFESLVLGIKRSSPMIIDNTGLQLKLGEAQEAYAESLGVTVEELSAEQKQLALLNATLEAGEGMVSAMGSETMTATEKMAKLRAQFQNIRDEIAKFLVPVFEKILDLIGPLATRLSRELYPAFGKIIEVVGKISSRVAPAFDTVSSVVSKLAEAFDNLRKGKFLDYIEDMGEGLAAISTPIGKIGLKIADFSIKARSAFIAMRKGIQLLWQTVKDWARWLLDKLRIVWNRAFEAMRKVWNRFWEAFSPYLKPIREYFEWWKSDVLLPQIERLSRKVADVYHKHLIPAVQKITNAVRKFIEKHPGFAKFLQKMIELVAMAAGGLVFGALLTAVLLVSGAIDVLTGILHIGARAIDIFASAISWLIDRVSQAIDVVNWLLDRIRDLWNWIQGRSFSFHISWPTPPAWLNWLMGRSISPAVIDVGKLNDQLQDTARLFRQVSSLQPDWTIPDFGKSNEQLQETAQLLKQITAFLDWAIFDVGKWNERLLETVQLFRQIVGFLDWAVLDVDRLNERLQETVRLFRQIGAFQLSWTVPVPAMASSGRGTQISNVWSPTVNAAYGQAQSPGGVMSDLETLAILYRMS